MKLDARKINELGGSLNKSLKMFCKENKLLFNKQSISYNPMSGEINVSLKLAAPVGATVKIDTDKMQMGFAPSGTKCLCLWSDGEWYDAEILRTMRTGKYVVQFDGETDMYKMPFSRVKART